MFKIGDKVRVSKTYVTLEGVPQAGAEGVIANEIPPNWWFVRFGTGFSSVCYGFPGTHIELIQDEPPMTAAEVHMSTSPDMVYFPPHYAGTIQPLDFFEANPELGYHQCNIIKYVCRYKKKGGLEDLKKARNYLNRLIKMEYPDGEEE
jgi:hypothetical protein